MRRPPAQRAGPTAVTSSAALEAGGGDPLREPGSPARGSPKKHRLGAARDVGIADVDDADVHRDAPDDGMQRRRRSRPTRSAERPHDALRVAAGDERDPGVGRRAVHVAVRDALAAQQALRREHRAGEAHHRAGARSAARQARTRVQRVEIRLAGGGQSRDAGAAERRVRRVVDPDEVDAAVAQRGRHERRTVAPGIRLASPTSTSPPAAAAVATAMLAASASCEIRATGALRRAWGAAPLARGSPQSRHLDYPGPPFPHPGVRMPSQGLGLAPRLRYLAARARRIDVGSVLERAKEASAQHGKWTPAVVVDMLWQAGLRNVGFQDYIDYDFAILSRDERATYMTHPVSNQLSQKYDHPDFRHIFQDKVEFDRVFSEHLHREWMVVEEGNADDGARSSPSARAPSSRRSRSARPAPACTATTRPRSTTGMPSTAACSRAASCSSKRSSCSIPISRPSAPAPSTRPGSPRSSTASRPTSSRWRRSSAAARSATR